MSLVDRMKSWYYADTKELQEMILSVLVMEPERIEELSLTEKLFDKNNKQAFLDIKKKINSGKQEELIMCLVNNEVNYDPGQHYHEFIASVNLLKMRYLENQLTSDIRGSDSAQEAVDKVFNSTKEYLNELSTFEITRLSETLEVVRKESEELSKKKTIALTGIPLIDEYAPFEEGKFVVIGARPSVGKSAFTQNIALNFAKTGGKVLFVSLEMNERDLMSRFFAMDSGIPVTRFSKIKRSAKDPSGSEAQQEMIFEACGEFSRKYDENLTILHEERITSGKLSGILRHNRNFQKYDLIIVDYIQLLSDQTQRGMTNAQRVGDISRNLKILAGEQKACVVGVVQLNRSAEGVEPSLHHIKDSGSIEQDANTVLLLNRERDARAATLFLSKNREGQANISRSLIYQTETCTFKPSTNEAAYLQ